MGWQVDWSKRGDYVRSRHSVEADWADEAVIDEHAVWLTPDPASRSGHAVRVIGYSTTARSVLTVILVDPEADPSEPPDGEWWGANAWIANEGDRRLYGEEDL
ncbi:MAG: transposase [Actinomycetota bacterium]|nr:transposase [Actinomycetota bacterium]